MANSPLPGGLIAAFFAGMVVCFLLLKLYSPPCPNQSTDSASAALYKSCPMQVCPACPACAAVSAAAAAPAAALPSTGRQLGDHECFPSTPLSYSSWRRGVHKMSQQVAEYRRGQSIEYPNNADFDAMQRLMRFVATKPELCNVNQNIFTAGVNEGNLIQEMMDHCRDISIHGFEILYPEFQRSSARFKDNANVHIYNMGWDEKVEKGLSIGGAGSKAGLFAGGGGGGPTVDVTTVSAWADEHNIDKVLFITIDTEGHEPPVLRGMRLDLIKNRERFGIIQYELGGTWAENDARHNHDKWDQYEAALYLDWAGYDLYLIGKTHWLFVEPEFFLPGFGAIQNEGNGPFVQGNIFALHREFANPDIKALVESGARMPS